MSNHHRRLVSSTKCIAACALLLLIGFNGIANAALSGIDPGYPRFIANKTYIDYYQASGSTYYFDAYNVNNKVFWQDSPTSSKQKIKGSRDFYAQVDIDASDPSAPKVVGDSFFQMWGNIPSLGTGNTLLFKADIDKLFWTTGSGGVIEFVMNGASMQGAVCDLGFCSFADEVLQFQMNNFNGNWGTDFFKTAKGIATVPLPAAAWLFGSALIGLIGATRRKNLI